ATGVVAVPAVLAADAGDGQGGDSPYADAHLVASPLGTLYGPVRAGPPSSTSYGYVTRGHDAPPAARTPSEACRDPHDEETTRQSSWPLAIAAPGTTDRSRTIPTLGATILFSIF